MNIENFDNPSINSLLKKNYKKKNYKQMNVEELVSNGEETWAKT